MTAYKAMGSRWSFDTDPKELLAVYSEYVEDILNHDMLKKLEFCSHHVDISRLQHSFNVSYYSFLAAKNIGLDARAAARGGLLHDLFFYDTREQDLGFKHSFIHPKIALRNAQEHFALTEKEQEIIVCHMWPVCDAMPKHAETYLISLVDKYCAAFEAGSFLVRFLRRGHRRRVN